ncbi:MAG: hypothetical protein K6E27_05380 [Eubacterium sp.]|nr:hypothetical protein [Eubacterium sp.]
MRRNGLNEARILSLLLFVMAILFFMPMVGIYMICRKDSAPVFRAIGAVLLVAGVLIMLHTGGAIGYLG